MDAFLILGPESDGRKAGTWAKWVINVVRIRFFGASGWPTQICSRRHKNCCNIRRSIGEAGRIV